MSKRLVRKVTVVEKTQLSPHFIRMKLAGDDLKSFPAEQESGYIKLRFPSDNPEKPILRTYTIRAFDPTTSELTVDFVAHGDNGPASKWAGEAAVGDSIEINGPGDKKLVDFSADCFLLVGDMTALPAISVNLEQLPDDAVGYAVLEVVAEEDKLALKKPAGVEICWVINPHPTQPNSCLYDAVVELPWQEGRLSAWVACEFDQMRAIRGYLRNDKGLDRSSLYASSYWKIGTSDEGNKAAKKLDTDA